MALVQCKECGTAVAESAPACPKCGVPSPAGLTSRVSVHMKRALAGAVSIVELYVDGRPHGRLENGGTTSVDLAPGEHEVVVITTGVGGPVMERECQFSTRGGQLITLECGFSVWTGFYLKGA